MAARKQDEVGNATRPLDSARDRFEAASTPAARARAAARLAHEMLMHDRAEAAAIALVEETEEALTPVELTPDVRRALAKLHEVHAQSLIGTRTAEARRHVETGLALLDDQEGTDAAHERAWLWIEASEPAGIDAVAVEALHAIQATTTLKPPVLVWIGIRTAELWKRRGDLGRAVEKLDEAAAITELDDNSRRVILDAKGRAARLAGRLDEAEALHREAIDVARRSCAGHAPGELELAICAYLRGDLATARERAHALLDDPLLGLAARRLSLECDLEEGRAASALRGLRAMLEEAIAARYDKPLHDGTRTYVNALLRAEDAGATAEGDMAMADALLAAAESTAIGIAGDDFAWYRVLFPAMHGEAITPAHEHAGTGVVMLRAAWKRAADEWPDAAPRLARTLVYALLREGTRSGAAQGPIEEASQVIEQAIPVASAKRHLRDLAHLLAARVAILSRTSPVTIGLRDAHASPLPRTPDAAAIAATMREMRAVIAETGAPRIAAEVLLDLGRALPVGSTDPDPVALLDEAASLFAAMPIPTQQGRCLEAAGDVLASRGATERADARYAEAESLLERHGLALGLARIARKRGHAPRSARTGSITGSRSSQT